MNLKNNHHNFEKRKPKNQILKFKIVNLQMKPKDKGSPKSII
jgi:hypothetical protein